MAINGEKGPSKLGARREPLSGGARRTLPGSMQVTTPGMTLGRAASPKPKAKG
jgi:hypothetical protein